MVLAAIFCGFLRRRKWPLLIAFFGGNTTFFDLNAGVGDSSGVTLHLDGYLVRLSPLKHV